MFRMITKSWHCIFVVDPYLHIFIPVEYFLVFLIEVSSSEDLKEPENEAAEISQPSLILDKPISDPFQSLGSQLTISHLGATWSSFHQITSNHFSVHLRSLHLQLRPSEELRPSGGRRHCAGHCSRRSTWPRWSHWEAGGGVNIRVVHLWQIAKKTWSGVYMFEELECPWLEEGPT